MPNPVIRSPLINEFRTSEPWTTELRQVLDNPTVKEALSRLQQSLVPTTLPENHIGVHHDTTIAHNYHFLMGASAALSKLQEMGYHASKRAPGEAEQFEDYEHSIPEDLRNPPTPQR